MELQTLGPWAEVSQSVYSSASRIVVCRLVYPEAHAAINALVRDKRVSRRQGNLAIAQINRDWKTYIKLAVSVTVCEDAAALTSSHPLKGADAIHLAAVRYFLNFEPHTQFFTLDKKLYKTAQKLVPVVPIPGW